MDPSNPLMEPRQLDLLLSSTKRISEAEHELSLLQIKLNNITLHRDNLQDENARLKRILDNTEDWQPGAFQRFFRWLFGGPI